MNIAMRLAEGALRYDYAALTDEVRDVTKRLACHDRPPSGSNNAARYRPRRRLCRGLGDDKEEVSQ